MSDPYREDSMAELDAILLEAVQEDADFKKIRTIPRLRELMAEARGLEKAVATATEKAECEWLQRRVTSQRGPNGERLWRYAEQIGFPFPGEERDESREPRPVYLPLRQVLETPDLIGEVLHRDRQHLSGYVRGMGEMEQAERDALRTYIESTLDRYIVKVAQPMLPFGQADVDDGRKDTTDKVGDEAAMEPRQAAGGDYLKG